MTSTEHPCSMVSFCESIFDNMQHILRILLQGKKNCVIVTYLPICRITWTTQYVHLPGNPPASDVQAFFKLDCKWTTKWHAHLWVSGAHPLQDSLINHYYLNTWPPSQQIDSILITAQKGWQRFLTYGLDFWPSSFFVILLWYQMIKIYDHTLSFLQGVDWYQLFYISYCEQKSWIKLQYYFFQHPKHISS